MSTLAADLRALEKLKRKAEAAGRFYKRRTAAFKEHELECIDRMDSEESESFRTSGTLFTLNDDRVKGQVDDRRRYVRWCLEQDDAVREFLEKWGDVIEEVPDESMVQFEEDFFDAVMSTSMVHMKEDQGIANSLAKSALDDDPKNPKFPPGLNFRPDPTIQQRRS